MCALSKYSTVYLLYFKWGITPIGVFDSLEALEKGKSEVKSLFSGVTDDKFKVDEFELNKLI